MTERSPEPQPQLQTPGPATDVEVTPEDTRQDPPTNPGSGQYAVWDVDLGQYVSGVSDKATADKARNGLKDVNGAITDGHKLETREV